MNYNCISKISVEIRNKRINLAMYPQREKMRHRARKRQSERHSMEESTFKM